MITNISASSEWTDWFSET